MKKMENGRAIMHRVCLTYLVPLSGEVFIEYTKRFFTRNPFRRSTSISHCQLS